MTQSCMQLRETSRASVAWTEFIYVMSLINGVYGSMINYSWRYSYSGSEYYATLRVSMSDTYDDHMGEDPDEEY